MSAAEGKKQITGKITRISGPIVYAEGLEGCGLYDVVDVGEKKIIGESGKSSNSGLRRRHWNENRRESRFK